MTEALAISRSRDGAVLCSIEARVPADEVDSFGGFARTLVKRTAGFGGRFLGAYVLDSDIGQAQDGGVCKCALLVTLANRAVFERFRESLSAISAPWLLQIDVHSSLGVGGDRSGGAPAVPYHLVRFH